MYPYRTFPLNKSDRIRHTELRRYAQANMNMVAHCMPFEQLYTFLTTQVSYDAAYFFHLTFHIWFYAYTLLQIRYGISSPILHVIMISNLS